MRVVSLASGSKGNAYLVEHCGEALLIDCGVCYKKLKGVEFSAVIVTHSHSDHVCGLPTLLKHRDVPVFANAMTAEATACECGVPEDAFVCFENGQSFDIGPFSVSPFSIPHDTSDPVGFLVSAGGERFHRTQARGGGLRDARVQPRSGAAPAERPASEPYSAHCGSARSPVERPGVRTRTPLRLAEA